MNETAPFSVKLCVFFLYLFTFYLLVLLNYLSVFYKRRETTKFPFTDLYSIVILYCIRRFCFHFKLNKWEEVLATFLGQIFCVMFEKSFFFFFFLIMLFSLILHTHTHTHTHMYAYTLRMFEFMVADMNTFPQHVTVCSVYVQACLFCVCSVHNRTHQSTINYFPGACELDVWDHVWNRSRWNVLGWYGENVIL